MDIRIAERQDCLATRTSPDRSEAGKSIESPRQQGRKTGRQEGKTLTRIELLDAVYEACSRLSRAESRLILNQAIEEIAGALVRGERVEIRSFGAFYVRSKTERVGRNPRSGEPAAITARRVARFRPSACLIERVGAAAADKS